MRSGVEILGSNCLAWAYSVQALSIQPGRHDSQSGTETCTRGKDLRCVTVDPEFDYPQSQSWRLYNHVRLSRGCPEPCECGSSDNAGWYTDCKIPGGARAVCE